MNNITKYLLIIIVLVILGGATIFLIKKSADTPIEDPVEDLVEDPVEDLVEEPVEDLVEEPVVEPVVERTPQVTKDEDLPPAPTPTTTPAKPLIQKPKPIANAPIKRSSPQEDVDDFDDGPTPTTTPAKPLVPATNVTTPAVAQSTPRLLTPKEHETFMNKLNNAMEIAIVEARKGGDDERADLECEIQFLKPVIAAVALKTYVSEPDIKVIMDPRITRDKPSSEGGFVPRSIINAFGIYMEKNDGRKSINQKCPPKRSGYAAGRIRLLTPKERATFINKFEAVWAPHMKHVQQRGSHRDIQEQVCGMNFHLRLFENISKEVYVNEPEIKAIMDPRITKPDSVEKGGFIPMTISKAHSKTMETDGERERQRECFNRTLPPLPPRERERKANLPPQQENTMIIGARGKVASEGGIDINNKTKALTFNPAKSAEIHIEHVDVHRADPVNMNGSITFIYRGGIEHKFTFVGNEGLRFQKRDGSFGPNMGVGDVSRIVLTDMGLNYLSYKIECLRTAGRNTWSFKPLDLSRGLVGIELADNADWGGLKGVYVKVQSIPTPREADRATGGRMAGVSAVSESRMGWPNGTKWNLRGKTGNDSQRCNDICKNLGYNYFTHNPPPADGGCGCFKSSAKLLQLTMTDHANAKTRRVV